MLKADWLFAVFQELEDELTEKWPSLVKTKSSFHFWYEILSVKHTQSSSVVHKTHWLLHLNEHTHYVLF